MRPGHEEQEIPFVRFEIILPEDGDLPPFADLDLSRVHKVLCREFNGFLDSGGVVSALGDPAKSLGMAFDPAAFLHECREYNSPVQVLEGLVAAFRKTALGARERSLPDDEALSCATRLHVSSETLDRLARMTGEPLQVLSPHILARCG